MSETEKKVLETVDKLVPELTEDTKESFRAFVEGMAFMADKPRQEASSKSAG